jgi:hypothetical protein
MQRLLLDRNWLMKLIFITTSIVIVLYVLLMTYLRPMAADDFAHIALTSGSITRAFDWWFFSYMNFNPRIGELFSYLMATTGTPLLFIIINPVVQLSTLFVLHFLVTGKKMNIYSRRDVFLFVILAVLFLFNTTGGHVFFWQACMANYSLTGLIFFLFLSLFRPLLDKKNNLSDGTLIKIAVFVHGFLTGMTNENISILSVFVVFGIWMYYKIHKFALPSWFYWALCGNILGVAALFGAPGSYGRMNIITDFTVVDIFTQLHLQETAQQYTESTFLGKIQFLPLRWGKFILLALGLPVITLLADAFILLKNKLRFQNNKYIYYSLACLLIGFTLSGMLCFAPKPSIRVYFSAVMFSNLSFVFLLLYLTNDFKNKMRSTILVTAFCILGITGASVLIPSFYELHTVNKVNLELISEALKTKEKRAELYIPRPSIGYIYSNPGEISEDETFWINMAMAQYYGLNSIVKKTEYQRKE